MVSGTLNQSSLPEMPGGRQLAGGFFPSQPALGGGVGEGQKGGRKREEREEENGERLAGQGCI